ncbi:hypothetical protein AB0L67_39910 [Streptomyces flaveolus]|uniref:hypothetical protein n=1 Tax=Streptomyces flaveolus TaxID=67297 RepID=UPI00342712FD
MRPSSARDGVVCRTRTVRPAEYAGRTLPVELLILPMPAQPFTCPRPHTAAEDRWWRETVGAAPTPPSGTEERSWYRWVIGHQVAFCIWRLMCDELSTVPPGDQPAGDVTAAMDRVAALYNSYSALLLYTGGCTPEIYHSVIRHNMISAHPAFSGTWARDYELTLTLLSERAEHRSAALKAALKTNRLVHMSVAKRLVPSGGSLLRDAGAAHVPVTEADRRRLDEFFGAARGAVCRQDLVAGVRRRLAAILRDMEEYPLDVVYEREQVDSTQARAASHLEWLGAAVAGAPPPLPLPLTL